MSVVIGWVKNNVLTVIAAVVVLASVVALVITDSRGDALVERMADRQGEIRKIENLFRTPVAIPPKEADGAIRKRFITVNQVAIDRLDAVYARMSDEYTNIFDLAVQMNREEHLPMLDGLFPSPTDPAKPFEAQRRYLDAFALMFDQFSPNALLPRLNAGGPVSKDLVNEELSKVERDYLTTNFFGDKSVSQLSASEQEKLVGLKRDALLKLLESEAQSIHVYADDDPSSSGYPFQIDEWSKLARSPAVEDIWDSQVKLWVQQDLVEAIGRTNRVSSSQSNVMNAPIKRLLGIDVESGYTGIDTRGMISDSASIGPGESRRADAPLPEDFLIAPSGRRSNDIYDVRHASLKMVIDSQRLPEFFDALSQVNFMTVLKIEFSQVDEYEVLREGYVYGPGDVVEATMVIETIWLREWTSDFMPESVKRNLGMIDESEENG